MKLQEIRHHKNFEIHIEIKTMKYIRNLQNNKIQNRKFGIDKFDQANMLSNAPT